jgi:hypothetical protein
LFKLCAGFEHPPIVFFCNKLNVAEVNGHKGVVCDKVLGKLRSEGYFLDMLLSYI